VLKWLTRDKNHHVEEIEPTSRKKVSNTDRKVVAEDA
jgi:hypothetical protein